MDKNAIIKENYDNGMKKKLVYYKHPVNFCFLHQMIAIGEYVSFRKSYVVVNTLHMHIV